MTKRFWFVVITFLLLFGGAAYYWWFYRGEPAAPAVAHSSACIQGSSPAKWKHFNAAPFASSRDEGMANREAAFRCLGLPQAVIDAAMEATKHPAEKMIRLAKGDRVRAMLSRITKGPRKDDIVVERTIRVDFVPTETYGMGYYANVEVWSITYKGKVYVIGLPQVCNNWMIVSITPVVRTPQVTTTKKSSSCYLVPVDYRHTPHVVWNDGSVEVEMHFEGMSKQDVKRLALDPCFFAKDATGIHVPFHSCTTCENGGVWPPADMARAVGLQTSEPEGAFTARMAQGTGIISLPLWAIAYQGDYCVTVSEYAVGIPGFTDWSAVSRFDIVGTTEMRRGLPQRRLGRTLIGILSY